MSRVFFHRPVRALPPSLPDQAFVLPAVPQRQSGQPANWLTYLLPLMSSVGLAAYMITGHQPVLVGLGVLFVLGAVASGVMMRHQMRSATRKAADRHHDRYLGYLSQVRQGARQVANGQRFAAAWTHPSPLRLWALAAGGRRVWERRASDPDFLRVRLGIGDAGLATPIQLGMRQDPLADYDDELLASARKLADRLGTVGRQPALADLPAAGVVTMLGPADRVRGLARSVVCQIAVLHAPDDVALMIRTAGDPGWEWAKWLPHAHEQDATAAEVVPMVAADMCDLDDLLEAEVSRAVAERDTRRPFAGQNRPAGPGRRLVVVLDGYDPAAGWASSTAVTSLLDAAGPQTGLTAICLVEAEKSEPGQATVRARVAADGALTLEGKPAHISGAAERIVADQIDPLLAELTARELAPLRLSAEPDRMLAQTIELADLLGVADLAGFDPRLAWLAHDDERVLRLPIGLSAEGQPVRLDLKESAQGGMGPHGLIVGATGSGKSELLRTLVTGLTMTHSPDLLSLVLVDFKGGATFAGLTELPHVAGLITNLADDLSLVDRVRAALHGEQQRRQKLLREAGNADSLRDYWARREAGGTDTQGRALEPLPYLLIIVDEFGELLSQRNDFIDLFVQIGRVGRSLGMHLLLATQRLDEGRLRGLESHLSYRICLRTFSAAESRAVIGSHDAYHLPALPGSAYLKVDESVYQRFRVAHISGRYAAGEAGVTAAGADGPAVIDRFGLRVAPVASPDTVPAPSQQRSLARPTVMQVAVGRLREFGEPAHQVWLPPLPGVIPLDAILGPLATHGDRGWQATLWPDQGPLRFPIGLTDLPFQQRQEPMLLDFGGKHGNLALVGAPQSGKSAMLRTMLLSAMLTHTPQELRFYCVDFGGGSLAPMAAAPHVGAVAGRRAPQLAERLLAEMLRLVAAREQLFAEHAIESPAAFRAAGRAGRLPAGTYAGDVLVVIDNWGAVRAELGNADVTVLELAFRGLGVGLHVVLTANRWADIRLNLRDGIGARLELRLNDSGDSEVSRPLSRQLAAAPPGRGVAPPGLLFQALAPRLDGREETEDMAEALNEVLAKIAAAWTGEEAPPIRLLPNLVTADELASAVGQARSAPDQSAASAVPFGLRDSDFGPVSVDLTTGDPHLLVLGDAGAGKSSFLRTFASGLVARRPPEAVRFLVVDYRRSLLGAVPEPYLAAYAGDQTTAGEYTGQLAAKLAGRLPPAGIGAAELRLRTWWSGPELYVLVDDYDLIGTGGPGPLAALAKLLPHAGEVGLHIVAARRVAGLTRASMSDPVLSRIRDLGTVGLVLSGDPREGVLLGGERAAERPPGRGALIRRGQPAELIQVALTGPVQGKP